MKELTPLYLMDIGLFVGIGWYLAKLVFVMLVTTFTRKQIVIATDEELD